MTPPPSKGRDGVTAWPDPTLEQLKSNEFEAVWQVIKSWDINVPEVYGGYCGATGNHVVAILNALHPETKEHPKGGA